MTKFSCHDDVTLIDGTELLDAGEPLENLMVFGRWRTQTTQLHYRALSLRYRLEVARHIPAAPADYGEGNEGDFVGGLSNRLILVIRQLSDANWCNSNFHYRATWRDAGRRSATRHTARQQHTAVCYSKRRCGGDGCRENSTCVKLLGSAGRKGGCTRVKMN